MVFQIGRPVTSGVSQGSVLGTLLVIYSLLYIDLNAKVGGVIGKFAVNGRALGSIAEKRILGGTCT